MRSYLLITQIFPPQTGGTSTLFYELYSRIGLTARVDVVTENLGQSQDNTEFSFPGFIHRIPFRRYSWLKPESIIIYIQLFFKSLLAAIKARHLHSIHAGRVLPEGLCGLVVSWLCRRPLVVFAHGEEITTWREPLKSLFLKFVFRRSDCVIANSHFTRQLLLGLGVSNTKVKLIYPGVDTTLFKAGLRSNLLREQLGLKRDSFLVLSVGRLTRRKGFDFAIKALSSMSDVNIHYAIIGRGDDLSYLKKIATEYGVVDQVHFMENVTNSELPLWYNAANLFVMPNREVNNDIEGFGIVLLEAAACGLPAIAGRSGGTESAIIEGETGLIIDANSVDNIVQAILSIKRNRALGMRMGLEGRRRCEKEFSWDIISEKYRLLFS